MSVVMSLHDDQYGRGMSLAFPSMSTCVAIILVTPTNLVGFHKIRDAAVGTPGDNKHNTLYTETLAALQGQPIQQLYLVGFMAHHDVARIKANLNVSTLPAQVYDLARKTAAVDWCTFAHFQAGGAGGPRIEIKRTSKVTVTRLSHAAPGPADLHSYLRAGRTEDVVAKNLHELRKHFYQV